MKNIPQLTIAIIMVLILGGCSETSVKESIFPGLHVTDFQSTLNGKETSLYYLENGNITAAITNYGGRIAGLLAPDRSGELADVILGFSSIQEYLDANEVYHGALIGRFGNRIANGQFTLEGEKYTLPLNNGPNHLHGGPDGFHNMVWDVKHVSDTTISLFYLSPDGQMGYPGNLSVTVTYTLTCNNDFIIDYHATTDKKTIVNLTSHPFFNLAGEGKGSINDHILTINADFFTPVDQHLIPLGALKSVTDTPFDFRMGKAIGQDLEVENEQLNRGKGYDHNFVLNRQNPDDLILAASIMEPKSGRKMMIYTQEPGIQFYGGNFMDGTSTGKSGLSYDYRESFALETQHFPDSPNQPNFPSTVLNPGEKYKTKTIYRFVTDND